MDPTTAATLGGAAGLMLGAVAMLAVRASERSQQREVTPRPEPELPEGVADVLSVLRSSGIVVDAADAVVRASPAAHAYGLVQGGEVTDPELRHLARQVRRDGVIREVELEIARGPLGRGRLVVGARVAPLGGGHVLLLVDDRTQARRVEEIRRDFVANVSHELKTPVGGLALLAEAVLDASDDPEAVRRFASRMQTEAQRLTRLVKEIVDLSRLQVADTLQEPTRVGVCKVVTDAADRSRVVAAARGIEIVASCQDEAVVYGDADLLGTAVGNLVDNAVAYSDPDTKVTVAVRRHHGLVEVAVTDSGIGIPEEEQVRIFERFYRVDPARSRSTGGTGLGLAIVKHVAANHGGEVTVWSRPGQGSTFTLRLPDATGDEPAEPGDAVRAEQATARSGDPAAASVKETT